MVLTKYGTINIIIAVTGIIVCLYTLLMIRTVKRKNDMLQRLILISIFSLLLYNGCLFYLELGKGVLAATHHLPWIRGMILADFGTYLFSAISAYVISNYVLFLLSPRGRFQMIMHIFMSFLLVLYALILTVQQYNGNLVREESPGVISAGEASYIGYLMVSVFMIIDIILILMYRDNLTKSNRIAFNIYLGMPLLSILLRPFLKDIYIVAFSSSISATILMLIIQREKEEEFRKQELRNEQLKVDILLGQIQPHFLFNVLYVIQEICCSDPLRASEAIEDFSKYLRHNMDSLSISRPIPFQEELDHTKHYVSLQQLRFGEALNVKYNLGCTDFSLPTLTLQPVVENAVRYGVRKNKAGRGTVLIQTREKNDCYEIDVIDDGPGFDPETGAQLQDGMSHMGIQNVRERLNRISGGQLIIDSQQGMGTTVRIILPREN